MYSLLHGDALDYLRVISSKSIRTCVTSPPYWGLRDYGVDNQLGIEDSPEEYTDRLVTIFREVRRVLTDDGTLWLNLGDSYNAGRNGGHAGGGAQGARKCYQQRSGVNAPNLKPKDLVGIPWLVAFALRKDGWYLRSEIIWHKPNAMPLSVVDRPTTAHEQLFLLSKNSKYFYDHQAIKEPAKFPEGSGNTKPIVTVPGQRQGENANVRGGLHKIGARPDRNKRSVWTVTNKRYNGAHFATYPPDLIEPCILAGSAIGDTVLDPFNGAGTTGVVAMKHGRRYIGIDVNADYLDLTLQRFNDNYL